MARKPTIALCALLGAAVHADTVQDDAPQGPEVEEIVVVADGLVRSLQGRAGSLSTVDADVVELVRANHVSETLARLPGVWIARASGHEHLTAIRSGVLAGAGACGAFLYLENGVPIRPVGFCNINNLFELNTEQAAAIEVLRGPASALFGGNALHGVVNVVTHRQPRPMRVSAEFGPHGYRQLRLGGSAAAVQIDAHSSATDGYRDDTGYGQHKLNIGYAADVGAFRVTNTLSASRLNQETGGYVRGHRAYADASLRTSNPNPEAYRDASSLRLASEWDARLGENRLILTPYLRRSSMEFLQHFLPGQPLETNAQTSGGAVLRYGSQRDDVAWSIGAHAELMGGELREHQSGATQGSAFLVATRPPGTHYDYDVDSALAAGFYDVRWRVAEAVSLTHSLRVERLAYDYDNHALAGNTRDDGTPCGFGGCLYTRPADRDDAFTDAAGRAALHWQASVAAELYVAAGLGFRPPQATELYRLQSGQTVADIDSESLASVEVGWRHAGERASAEAALYAERTSNLIFRDADGYNVSDGKTRSTGLEFALQWQLAPSHALAISGTWARHRYAFDRAASRGEVIADGNDVDTAPRWLGGARWSFRRNALHAELEANYVGSHFINAANTERYEGHLVLHLRGNRRLTERVTAFARVLNVTDRRYADRADYAFGSYRYFPAMPRQFYLGIELTL